ncbi:MAG: hypothetical protein CR981_03600 [Proteobacteria bacterium]|nr:MAG: hypothetical protein CR981_03600 [Pseudomonadota bacterium]
MAEDKRDNRFVSTVREIGYDTLLTAGVLIKVTVPVVIVTKILEELGVIVYLSRAIEPIMELMGLPGELGLVWATGMITSLYGALAVFAALAPGLDLTAAQVTVLGCIMLVAHSLPVEMSITRKAGAGLLSIGAIRIFGAMLFGVLLYRLLSFTALWQEPAHVYFQSGGEEKTMMQWAIAQVSNLLFIFFVIFLILTAMRLLKMIGFLSFLERLLKPVLPFFGMSHRAAPVTVVGMIVGLAYGGALIIRETTKGVMNRREIFNSLALMSLSHALVEDTLLMLAIGAKLGGILWGRLLFSLLALFLIARLVDMLYPEWGNEETCDTVT